MTNGNVHAVGVDEDCAEDKAVPEGCPGGAESEVACQPPLGMGGAGPWCHDRGAERESLGLRVTVSSSSSPSHQGLPGRHSGAQQVQGRGEVESILSPTVAVFLPSNQEVRKERLDGNLKYKKENISNSHTDNSEISSGVPTPLDAQGLGLVEYGQDWMGDINKNISMEQKVKMDTPGLN